MKNSLKGVSVMMLDADTVFLDTMSKALNGHGAEVLKAGNLQDARGVVYSRPVSAVVASLELIGDAPESFISEYKIKNPGGLFYLLIEGDTQVTAEDPSGLLVDEYLQKPVDPERFVLILSEALGLMSSSTALEVVDPVISEARPYFSFRSKAMREALKELPQIAASDQTVLITGETGTGKEIISHAIHVLSPRADGPFVAINCGAIPEGLIEGELFGHEKGAFTGAQFARKGKFEVANGGTLLLDEIGDMPLQLQMRLLRVLEERKVFRVGAERARPVNVRVIAATLRDLKSDVQKGLFREDLYYRLNVLKLNLPRLSERVEDISLLAVYFMDRAFREMGRKPPYPTLSAPAIELLEGQPWRGNVRELRNVITRVATFLPAGARRVLPMHVMPYLEDTVEETAAGTVGVSLSDGVFIPEGSTLKHAEAILIDDALGRSGGNRTLAAKRLGIGIRTLRRKLN